MACNTTYLLDAWSEARKFDFSLLYDYARKIYEICPLDTRLVPGTQLLTLEAAMEFARETYAWSSWTPYPAGTVRAWHTVIASQLLFLYIRLNIRYRCYLNQTAYMEDSSGAAGILVFAASFGLACRAVRTQPPYRRSHRYFSESVVHPPALSRSGYAIYQKRII